MPFAGNNFIYKRKERREGLSGKALYLECPGCYKKGKKPAKIKIIGLRGRCPNPKCNGEVILTVRGSNGNSAVKKVTFLQPGVLPIHISVGKLTQS